MCSLDRTHDSIPTPFGDRVLRSRPELSRVVQSRSESSKVVLSRWESLRVVESRWESLRVVQSRPNTSVVSLSRSRRWNAWPQKHCTGHLRPTPNDSERLWTIPGDSRPFQTASDYFKRLWIMLGGPAFRSRLCNFRSRIGVEFGFLTTLSITNCIPNYWVAGFVISIHINILKICVSKFKSKCSAKPIIMGSFVVRCKLTWKAGKILYNLDRNCSKFWYFMFFLPV